MSFSVFKLYKITSVIKIVYFDQLNTENSAKLCTAVFRNVPMPTRPATYRELVT